MERTGSLKKDAKELGSGWAVWLGATWLTADDLHNRNLQETVSMILWCLVTAALAWTHIRFLARLAKAARQRFGRAAAR
ncbi:hypothetical protein ACF06X_34030 [Streptomyces sp. NPDC015346]|uniref:hypothetical protein n=1 Tax=Streptomyces sp. NPDC015346 TaxID=3364954 RepID=UPI0036FC8A9F